MSGHGRAQGYTPRLDEDLPFERGIHICHKTVRFWWNRFRPLFAGDIRRQRVSRMHGFRQWRGHLDEKFCHPSPRHGRRADRQGDGDRAPDCDVTPLNPL